MEIKHEIIGSKGSFMAIVDGKHAGLMTYSKAGDDKIIIDHTEVDPVYKGQNIGKQLVMAAVEMARIQKIKIMPLCPFAKSVFDRTAELKDVLW
ncbi:MAG TPA: GNAT family N-acetyltransferase [Flavobacteriales bacterium]|nr:GNAT family N-acetyltransferase [Flavobacteriales bacterium]